jgi:hypothetical protein
VVWLTGCLYFRDYLEEETPPTPFFRQGIEIEKTGHKEWLFEVIVDQIK